MKHTFVLLLLTGTFSASGQWLTDSLIAHFPMDGAPNDVIGGLVPVVTSGAPAFCADRHGMANGAACFNGSSFWSYGDVLDMDTEDFSLAAWIRVDTVLPPFEIAPGFVSEGSTPFGKGNSIFSQPSRAGYSLVMTNSGTSSVDLYGVIGDNDSDVRLAVSILQPDQWTHVVYSRCNTHLLLYVNGAQVTDTIIPLAENLDVNTVFRIGGMDRDPSQELDSEWFIGAIDDLRIYKGRCLSQGAIDSLFYGQGVGLAPTESITSRLLIHPDPAADQVWITTSIPATSTALLIVIDATGRVVFERNVNSATLELDVAHLKPGAYCVRVASERGQAYARFIKE